MQQIQTQLWLFMAVCLIQAMEPDTPEMPEPSAPVVTATAVLVGTPVCPSTQQGDSQ